MRTAELDKRFAGFWYCYTCQHYVCNLDGVVADHTQHDTVKIEKKDDA